MAPAMQAPNNTPQLTMADEIYDALVTRVGSALNYDIRWQPNESEPDGFVERIGSLELINGTYAPAIVHNMEHSS